jgi:hypothetical protein
MHVHLSPLQSRLTRTWIVHQSSHSHSAGPAQAGAGAEAAAAAAAAAGNGAVGSAAPAHAHAGFLLGLGLQGHLSALAMTDVYEYLLQVPRPPLSLISSF